MVDSNGEVTEINGTSEKASAQGHSAGMSTDMVRPTLC